MRVFLVYVKDDVFSDNKNHLLQIPTKIASAIITHTHTHTNKQQQQTNKNNSKVCWTVSRRFSEAISSSLITELPTMSYRSSDIWGLGAVVHLAPCWKYSFTRRLYTRYSKNRDLQAIGASMISSPITIRMSLGMAAYKPETSVVITQSDSDDRLQTVWPTLSHWPDYWLLVRKV